ncbi:hypothetical protein MAH1_17710 [Sessilibacter sp. MAH1]
MLIEGIMALPHYNASPQTTPSASLKALRSLDAENTNYQTLRMFVTALLLAFALNTMVTTPAHAAKQFDFTVAQAGGNQDQNNHPRPGFRQPGSLSKTPQSDQRKNSLQSSNALPKGINSNDAANIAKSRFGGKVLRVNPSSDGHLVKLLLPSGKITYVNVNANGDIQ